LKEWTNQLSHSQQDSFGFFGDYRGRAVVADYKEFLLLLLVETVSGVQQLGATTDRQTDRTILFVALRHAKKQASNNCHHQAGSHCWLQEAAS
jgi:hypothetical protein